MNYRKLGKTGLQVSEIGFGGEWLERHPEEDGVALIKYAAQKGINVIDCWMADPKSRDIIGKAMEGNRSHWIVQGHIGSTWQNGQYVRTRDMKYVVPAFEDLLKRLRTDYVDLGMIHYVDAREDWDKILNSDFLRYVKELKESGKIRHIGLSTHNPVIAKLAVESGFVEMLLSPSILHSTCVLRRRRLMIFSENMTQRCLALILSAPPSTSSARKRKLELPS